MVLLSKIYLEQAAWGYQAGAHEEIYRARCMLNKFFFLNNA
jgi:hypothetical protein